MQSLLNHRPHQALGNRAPMAIWREAMIGALPPTAVDMTLRGGELGRRHRVAHIPTAPTAANGSLIFMEVRTAPLPT
jgi:hypothetical protein